MSVIKPKFGHEAQFEKGDNDWDVSYNSLVCDFDRFVFATVIAKVDPVPTAGNPLDAYINSTTGDYCYFDGITWQKYTPRKGFSVWDCSANGGVGGYCVYNGAQWLDYSTIIGNNITINTQTVIDAIKNFPSGAQDFWEISTGTGAPSTPPTGASCFPVYCDQSTNEIHIYDTTSGVWKKTGTNTSFTCSAGASPIGGADCFIDISWLDPQDFIAIINGLPPGSISVQVQKSDIIASDITDVFTGNAGQLVCTNALGMIDGTLIADGTLTKADLNTSEIATTAKSPNKLVCTDASGCVNPNLLPPIPSTSYGPNTIPKSAIATSDIALSTGTKAANAGKLVCLDTFGCLPDYLTATTTIGTGAPATSGQVGELYCDSVTGDIYIFDGTTWSTKGGAISNLRKTQIDTQDIKDSGVAYPGSNAADASDLVCLNTQGRIDKTLLESSQTFITNDADVIPCTDSTGSIDPKFVQGMPSYANGAAFVADHGGPVAGDRYFNTTYNQPVVYHGSVWIAKSIMALRVGQNIGQLIPSAGAVVNWNSIGADPFTAFNAAGDFYNCPFSGNMHISVGIEFEAEARIRGERYFLAIQINGVDVTYGYDQTDNTTSFQPDSVCVSRDITVNAGDLIRVRAVQSHGASVALQNLSQYNYFTLSYIEAQIP